MDARTTAASSGVPKLGLGTWQLRGATCREAVRHALELGYRHIDTARMYRNEREVGAGLRDSGVARAEVFVVTKIWPDDLQPDRLARQTEASLSDLGLDYVDVLLIHWPNPSVPLQDTLGAMTAQVKAGRVRSIGVSNFSPELMQEALAAAPIACNQVKYHPGLDRKKLLEACRESEVVLTAYSPLAKGSVANSDLLERIGAAHGKSAPQVAIRWLLQQDVVSVIPRSSSAAHRAANADVFDFGLTDREMTAIDELSSR